MSRDRDKERERERERAGGDSDRQSKGAKCQYGEIKERRKEEERAPRPRGEEPIGPGEGPIFSPPPTIRALHPGLGTLRQAFICLLLSRWT